ncbi:MAG: hypothetical protein ACPHRC_08925 [Candidatus Puniceispirillales bacterium]
MKHIFQSRLYIVLTAMMMSLFYSGSAMSDASCGSITEASAEVSMEYVPKFLSSKPQDKDVDALQQMAIKAAWEEYVSGCMNPGRLQQYLAKKDMIISDIDDYVSVVAFEHAKNKNKKNILDGRIVIRIKTNLVDALFAQQSGTVGGRGIRMMWLFTTSQVTGQQDSTLQAFDPDIDTRNSSKTLNTLDNTYQSDGTNTVESTLTESMTQSKSSGSTTTGGNISTIGTTQIGLNDKINAVFGVSMKQGLTRNNFRPTQYDYVAARCGGVDPREIERDIAFNGVMSMENLISVETAAMDCRMELMAIGTIDIGIPKSSSVNGYTVSVSVTGEIIDLRDGMPFTIAAFGPVQHNDGGADEATAIRNAIANVGTKTAVELANVLDANGIR